MSKNCTKIVNHSKIEVEENKRKAIFRNDKRLVFHVTQVDDCLVTSGPRADFLVSEGLEASVLIELKGSAVEHACDQLLASREHEAVKPLLGKKVGFLIICSRYPRFDTYVARMKQRCARQYKSGFHVVCDQREFDIRRVVEIDGP